MLGGILFGDYSYLITNILACGSGANLVVFTKNKAN